MGAYSSVRNLQVKSLGCSRRGSEARVGGEMREGRSVPRGLRPGFRFQSECKENHLEIFKQRSASSVLGMKCLSVALGRMEHSWLVMEDAVGP